MAFSKEDYRYMGRAIQLAKKGIYSTRVNPRVGCVLVKSGKIIGEGWHIRPGEGHAEINALACCSESPKGATAYVSLEPCSHFGKTPPCAEALASAGVANVIAAMEDPNVLVAGRGFQRLKESGIGVSYGLMAEEAQKLNPGFIRRCQDGLPYVRVKLGCSLDGRIAMASGESKWITGSEARQDVQLLRARSGAIISGAQTVRFDNPSLTVRPDQCDEYGQSLLRDFSEQPVRVVLSSSGNVAADSKVFSLPGSSLLLTPDTAVVEQALAVRREIVSSEASGKLDLVKVLQFIGSQGVNEVLVEAGGELAGQFIEKGLCDELWVYVAPSILGQTAKASIGMTINQMKDKMSLDLQDVRRFGNDLRMIYTF